MYVCHECQEPSEYTDCPNCGAVIVENSFIMFPRSPRKRIKRDWKFILAFVISTIIGVALIYIW